MNLRNKKQLASKVLKVGANRIVFDLDSLKDIKEAITKQDIKDLFAEGIISIKDKKGRRKVVRRKNKRGPGKIKKKIKRKKQDYVKITRKLRATLKTLKDSNEITGEKYKELRKKVRDKAFKSKTSLKEFIKNENK